MSGSNQAEAILGGNTAPQFKAADPLQTLQNVQSYANAVTQNQVMQQGLAVSKQDLAQKMAQRHAQIMAGILSLPQDQRYDAAQQALDLELSTNQIDPQRHAVLQAQLKGMQGDPTSLDRSLAQGIVTNMTAPQQMQALSPPVQFQDVGNAIIPRVMPSDIQRLQGNYSVGTAPGGVYKGFAPQYIERGGEVTPVGGALGAPNLTTNLTPAQQALQVGREITPQDIQTLRASGVPEDQLPKEGQKVDQPLVQRLQQQGLGHLLPGGGMVPTVPTIQGAPGQPAGGAPGAAGATPQRTVPPVSSTGQPVGPQNPAQLPNRMVVTTAPPNTATENQQDATRYGGETVSASTFPQENQQYGTAMTALRNVQTGPGTEAQNHWQSFLLAVAPGIAQKLGVNPDEVASYDEAKKYLTNLAQQTPGAAGSDMRTALAQISNPSTEISNKAAQQMLGIAQAFRQGRQIMFQQWQKDHPNTGDSQGLNRFLTDWTGKFDYHALLPMSEADFRQYYGKLKGKAKQNMYDSQVLVNNNPVQ